MVIDHIEEMRDMKNDLISRASAINIVRFECGEWEGLAKTIIKRFEQLPSTQSESKKGKWIEAYDPFNRISGRCSVCGWEAHLYEDDVVGMNYCPNCGAKMEDVVNEF